MASIDSRDRATIFIHFYRAMVGRADIWRMRMDATTNWAIGTTAAVVCFALGNAGLPHYAVLLALLLTLCFLMLEARRLTFYHLWQRRVLQLEDGMMRPALHAPPDGGSIELDEDLVDALDQGLGHTVPTMPILKATARRLRRVYLYLFAAQWLAWGLAASRSDAIPSSGIPHSRAAQASADSSWSSAVADPWTNRSISWAGSRRPRPRTAPSRPVLSSTPLGETRWRYRRPLFTAWLGLSTTPDSSKSFPRSGLGRPDAPCRVHAGACSASCFWTDSQVSRPTIAECWPSYRSPWWGTCPMQMGLLSRRSS